MLGISPQPLFYERLAEELSRKVSQGALLRNLDLKDFRVDFCSNDYLGYARSPLLEANILARLEHSPLSRCRLVGATGSRLLTGNDPQALALEQELASFFGFEKALLFNSGYNLNLGLLATIPQRGDCLLIDANIHASFRAGAQLSKASSYFFRHNDLKHLEDKLGRLSSAQVFVVVESLYSMDGDIAPLLEISKLCERYRAHLIVDEAHAVGTLGQARRGLVYELGLQDKVLALNVTFGKALGCHGACLLARGPLIPYMINFCQALIYTTALPPSSWISAQESFRLLQEDANSHQQLSDNIQFFHKELRAHGIRAFFDQQSPIYAFVFGDGDQNQSSLMALQECAALMKQNGLGVLPIYSPSVKRGTERLRVCLHSFNTKEEIQELIKGLLPFEKFWKKY